MIPVVQPGQQRITITVTPTGIVGENAMNVTPEGFPGGWPQVFEALLFSLKIVAREMAVPQQPVVPFLIPNNGATQ
jgi:hypothetical protein